VYGGEPSLTNTSRLPSFPPGQLTLTLSIIDASGPVVSLTAAVPMPVHPAASDAVTEKDPANKPVLVEVVSPLFHK